MFLPLPVSVLRSNTRPRISSTRTISKIMAHYSTQTNSIAKLDEFRQVLASSDRILALLGAGLSASSGLPTFRGAGGMWRTHEATSLATPEAFMRDPGLVWQFYSHRRHMALKAKPNAAHYALAELAKRKPNFLTLSQNVDGLSPRAGHPSDQLYLLHGNLFDIKCFNEGCGYFKPNNLSDPIVPALAETPELVTSLDQNAGLQSSTPPPTATNTYPTIPISELPHCPKCKTGLLRPGVVWFGEKLPVAVVDAVDQWIDESPRIDLMLVIGTTAQVYPAAAYIEYAREKGARVAVFNMDKEDLGASGTLGPTDWMFEGDAAVWVPEMFKGVAGDVAKGA